MRIRKNTKSELIMPDKLTIPRGAWVSGEYEATGASRMLNEDNRMCCLGHLCHAAGVGAKHMEEAFEPSSVRNSSSKEGKDEEGVVTYQEVEFPFFNIPQLTTMKGVNTRFSVDAMYINDDRDFSPADREEELIALFKKNDIELKFTGKYPNGVLEEAADRLENIEEQY